MIDKPTRLMLMMLCDIQEHLGIEQTVNPRVLREALVSGHDWYVQRHLQVLPSHKIDENTHREAVDMIDMWAALEWSLELLDPSEKKLVTQAPVFQGFDGNNEQDYFSVAQFYINDLERWDRFRHRDLNSHFPVLDRYQAMLENFAPMRRGIGGRGLSATQINAVMAAY